MAVLTWMGFPGSAEQWRALGFSVGDDEIRIGSVVCALGMDAAWGFDVLGSEIERLGVPTRTVPATGGPAGSHRNRVDLIDHVVYTVPDLDDAVGALTDVLGAEPRRRFKPRGEGGPEMAFYRVGEALIEVVASGKPAALIGVAFMCPDLDECVAAVREAGGAISDPRPAVQGGRIASVQREHGLQWGVAIMDPPAR